MRAGTSIAPYEGVSADLAYGEWPGVEPAIVLVPGIFASHRALAALAIRLAPAHRVVAFDLRGRGHSPRQGPFGIARHATDLWAAIDGLGLQRPLLAGHSLGAYVVATAVAARPRAVPAIALLDGGLWAPYPVPVELVHHVFADSRARLEREFESVEEYAVDRGIATSPEALEELSYELEPCGDRLAPRMPVAAFDEDVASIADHAGGNRPLGAAGCSCLVIRALRGIGGDPQAQMLPDATIDDARRELAELRVVDLAESTHGELVREPYAARVAEEILG